MISENDKKNLINLLAKQKKQNSTDKRDGANLGLSQAITIINTYTETDEKPQKQAYTKKRA